MKMLQVYRSKLCGRSFILMIEILLLKVALFWILLLTIMNLKNSSCFLSYFNDRYLVTRLYLDYFRSNRWHVFYKIAAQKNFARFTGAHFC